MSSIPRAIQDIKGCIQALTNEQENGPITDNCTELQKFCAKLEYVLQIDMKVRVGMLGGKKDYWDFFCSCLGKVKGLNDGIRFVKNMKEVKTSLGRGRAFIRYSLVHHRLGDTLQQCVSSEEITRQWYNESSILRQPGAFSAVVNDFYDLNDIQFDLTPSGQELDTAWPTFARSAIGVGLYLWNPPTRSSSMASINSQPSQADSRGMESMTEVDSAILDNQLERLQGELAECEKYNRDLRHQLQASQTELEECKSLAVENEARMSSSWRSRRGGIKNSSTGATRPSPRWRLLRGEREGSAGSGFHEQRTPEDYERVRGAGGDAEAAADERIHDETEARRRTEGREPGSSETDRRAGGQTQGQ
ncbi:putative FYVE and coiled-coil domain-containing protein 1 isoform X2 [Apostichopus japonicus]|uniref:RUN and FYVE domain-containing protein 4 n=1 Tax=Stichopus japonicus TaxID=307972 RepID=A0A2G8KME7_STIJA|nr:putative FYVE and coiled-coil domain-containing protein 1 isoform X2 [Apostichopus japonicus]